MRDGFHCAPAVSSLPLSWFGDCFDVALLNRPGGVSEVAFVDLDGFFKHSVWS